MEKEYNILGEQVLQEQGSYKRVRQWISGHHPELGVITTRGLTGNETIVEKDIITPVVTVTVFEREAD